MKALVLLHRWLGIGFCLLFAMWFASGIVMHFVPFPSLTEAERFAGLLPIDLSQVRHGPDEAVRRERRQKRAGCGCCNGSMAPFTSQPARQSPQPFMPAICPMRR